MLILSLLPSAYDNKNSNYSSLSWVGFPLQTEYENMNINTVCLKEASDYGNEVNNNTSRIHLHKLISVCL